MSCRRAVATVAVALAAAGCSTYRESSPMRTATEQLLISRAADEAAERLTLALPEGARVYVDASYVGGVDPKGNDGKYAVGALRARLVRLGAKLVPARLDADVVVELRSGALSIDESQTLFGIPSMDVPVPLAGKFEFPEIALFKRSARRGVAKIAATAYDARDGRFIATSALSYGSAHVTRWVVLLFVSWTTDDLMPDEEREPHFDVELLQPMRGGP